MTLAIKVALNLNTNNQLIKSSVNPLLNDNFLDVTKLKAFADDKMDIAKIIISFFDRVENIAGKGENAGYHHFLLFPQCFQKAPSSGLLKFGIVRQRLHSVCLKYLSYEALLM